MKATDLQTVENSFTNSVNEYQQIGLSDPDKAKCIQIIQREASILSNEEKRKNDLEFQDKRFELDKDHTYFQESLEKDKLKQQKESFEYQKIKDSNESKFQDKRFELDKDHTCFQESLEKDKLKQQKESFEYQKIKDSKDLEFQDKRFELDKDHTYFQESLEKDKLKQQKESFEYQKIKDSNDLELQKIRLELEKNDLEARRAQERNESKFRWITFGITTGLAFVQFAMTLMSYRKLAYTNLKLIYKDEGRPTTEYKDAIKDVKNLLK